MSKQRKLQDDAIKLLADGLSLSDAAQKLGVARSTIHRWMGKPEFLRSLDRAKGGALKDKIDQVEKVLSKNVVAEFVSKANENLLVLSATALVMARNTGLSETVRLNAMARFQSLLKDLRLINPDEEKGRPRTAANMGPKIEKSTKDPRGILCAVSK